MVVEGVLVEVGGVAKAEEDSVGELVGRGEG